jgi:diacylglycerol kinase family enzyme
LAVFHHQTLWRHPRSGTAEAARNRRPLAHTPVPDRPARLAPHRSPLDLHVDGEIRGHTPAQITLEANALRVMVATDFPDA